MSIFFHQGSIKDFIKRCPIVSILAVINTVVYVAQLFVPYLTDFDLIEEGALYYGAVYFEEYYRLLTAMFLHNGSLHYIFNILFGILIISAGLEKLIGSFRFLIVYFVSGLFSSFLVALTPSHYFTAGASGAIYGALGFLLFIVIFKKDLLLEGDRRYVVSLLIINAIFTVIFPSISIMGHFGGFVAGSFLGTILLINFKRRIHYW